MHIGRKQPDISITFQRMVLHGLESVDKARTTIGVDKVIATVNGKRHGIGFLCCCHTESNGHHDGIAVGNDGYFHRFLGIMTIGNIDVVCER